MIKLNSGIKREINSNFVLDEDGIRRIVGVLEAKASLLANRCTVVMAVHREDDRFYETTDVTDVLNDANTVGHKVQSISIQLRIADPAYKHEPWERSSIVEVIYKLSEKDKIQINVNAEDRTWALLLADELEPQVHRTTTAEKIPTGMLFIFFVAIVLFLITLIRRVLPQIGLPATTTELLEGMTWLATGALVLTMWGDRPPWLARIAGPLSAFSWGDQAISHRRAQERQKNFFWVVLVGAIVSVGSSLYTAVVLPSPALAADTKPVKPAASSP